MGLKKLSIKIFVLNMILWLSIASTACAPAKAVDVKFSYGNIPPAVKTKISGVSYKKNGPIKMEDLSYVKVTYFGFDGKDHTGELIVNKKLAKEVCDIFKELYKAKYPIDKIKLVDDYKGSDELSMSDDNTYAFCVRPVTGTKNKFSNHSYGIAIDINPRENPYIKGKTIDPINGKSYANRKTVRKGMIVKGDACYNAFKKRGWIWGGDWKSLKDYQHFEKEVK